MIRAPLPLLRADCSSCAALCCVLTPFRADSGFGVDKPAGPACHHLSSADRCTIHESLRERGWPGCTVFDCFGAGQQVTQVTYAGRSWRDPGADRGEMAAVLSVMRMLHEALRHLAEVLERSPAPDAEVLVAELADAVALSPAELLVLDMDEVMGRVGALLRAGSARLRPADAADLSRSDLSGRDLRSGTHGGGTLKDADLHGALLLAADLRGLDLGRADLLGADVRDADVRNAQLTHVLYLTQSQVNATRGNARTALPAGIDRPGHWPREDADGPPAAGPPE
ncbi:pentapeptide repeat-containing protein [Nocardioides sp. 616]|uniref:pentapeptide repeat-containing protein n=1 Tax=Nocardioides sp. 616 TaxID=2268090 RepID=UPI000CE4E9AF|nr:pentapeptide repeat-containing protein [Nocardioides sp. 616]